MTSTYAIQETFRRAVVRATLAPSIHNTQPWRFVLRPGVLDVYADRGRQLAVLDPAGRQLYLSVGCAVFNARVSLADSGVSAAVGRLPDAAQPSLLATVEVGPGAVEFEIDALGLLPGMYHISATLVHKDQVLGTAIDYQRRCLTFRVDGGKLMRGSFYMPYRWRPVPPTFERLTCHAGGLAVR